MPYLKILHLEAPHLEEPHLEAPHLEAPCLEVAITSDPIGLSDPHNVRFGQIRSDVSACQIGLSSATT